MEFATQIYLEIIKVTFPISLIWALGTLAYRSVLNALTGKDVNLR